MAPYRDGSTTSSQRVYSDGEIQAVADHLNGQGRGWGQSPRTYIVLQQIERLDLMDTFLKFGFTDHWFPVSTKQLPPSLPPNTRAGFVEAQSVVLTKSLDVEKPGGPHRNFREDESLPFETLGILGSGGYSQVTRSRSKTSGKLYAIKHISRRAVLCGISSDHNLKLFQDFLREMKIHEELRGHQHIVNFVGSYTTPKFICLILEPIADMNLSEYLSQATKPTDRPTLRGFFGCLASTLNDLHTKHNTRHRDIKPSNILVKGGEIFLADFGLSKSYKGEATTTYGSTTKTPKYCAPEVFDGERRDHSSDVWSLGCVFLEMLVALKGHNASHVEKFLKENGTRRSYYHRNLEAVQLLLQELELQDPDENKLIKIIRRMLSDSRSSRPTAAEVRSHLTTPDTNDSNEESPMVYCGFCCAFDDSSDSNNSVFEEALDNADKLLRESSPGVFRTGSETKDGIELMSEPGRQEDIQTSGGFTLGEGSANEEEPHDWIFDRKKRVEATLAMRELESSTKSHGLVPEEAPAIEDWKKDRKQRVESHLAMDWYRRYRPGQS